MEKFIPARPGVDIGCGFNTITGEVRGLSVGGEIGTETNTGQNVRSSVKIAESQEQMNEALDVSVEVSGHYGLFSAEGRFGLAQETSYTAQSIYVVAKCVVENPFQKFVHPSILSEASQRLRDDGPDAFKAGYGDAFVHGMRTGGELYAVFQLTSASTEEQQTVAASMQAELQGLFAGGSISASVQHMKNSKASVSSMTVVFYQRAGSDNSISPVTSPEEIVQRLKGFPAIAKNAPVGYQAQILDYQVLALPSFDEVGYQQRTEAMEDYARLKVKFLSIRSEIDLVRHNPQLFVPDYKTDDLPKSYDIYTRAINMLNRHARRVASKEIEASLFDPSAYDPELSGLPVYIFKKKAPESDIVQVPHVIGLTVKEAKDLLRSQGLNPISNAKEVKADSNLPIDVVTEQVPRYSESLPKGASVVISYNYILSVHWFEFERPLPNYYGELLKIQR